VLTVQGEPWLAVLQGHELDPVKQQEDQQRLLLERFQREVRLADLGRSCLQASTLKALVA
jgi:hypothetical protein